MISPQAATRAMPYQGLAPYSEDDAGYFFGRESEREIIIANLMASRLTVLYGPSGVGKSSVLSAGVSHRLRSHMERAGEDARVAVTVFRDWKQRDVIGRLMADVEAAAGRARKGLV